MTTGCRNLMTICLAAVLAFGLAACGGGSTKSAAELEMERLAAAEAACTAGGGRWESDNTCTSADEREMEAAEMACTSAGGRYESDGSCTSAAELQMERLAAAEMACTAASGRWNADDTCTSAAELVLEAAEAACVAGGGRWEADGMCTSASELEAERIAAARMACTDAGGRYEADGSCTDADALAAEALAEMRMACTDAGGRWNPDDTCTDAAGLAAEALAAEAMACTDAGGRWNADNTCTDSDGLEMERLAGLEMACEAAGGRWESDNTCTSADEREMLAAQAACTDAGGRYNADGSCTSAAELEVERLAAAEAACTTAAGQWNSDTNSCTSAAELLLIALETSCEALGGRWNDNNTCTSPADLEAERIADAKAACEGMGGRFESDESCTSAEMLEMERLAGLRTACEADGGRFESDESCTSAAEIAEMECTDAMGRWENGACTSATDLAEAACTGADGRWNGADADDPCTEVDELADEQRDDINTKLTAAVNAINAVNNESSDADVTAAESALETLRMAVANAANIGDAERAAFNSAVGGHESTLTSKKTARQLAMDAEDKTDAATMAAVAAKLYAGISAPMGTDGSPANNDRIAAYTGTNDSQIRVTINDATSTAPGIVLSEDKKTTVAANHGWAGKRYMHTVTEDGPTKGDMYEAYVYSNVEAPTQGDKFGQIGVGTPVDGYEYGLSPGGQIVVDTSTTATYVDLIDSSSFDHTAGVKRFPLPDPNPGLATVRSVPGTFHGVSGTYTCTPATAVCAANVSGDGFKLGTVPDATTATFTDGGGAWMFKPTNPEARVMDAADTSYASYGWWLKKAANDGPFTASAFVDEKGAQSAAATGLNDLNGTATYTGGAAGKYALASSTGGTNDAGHFTARATLEADFTNNTDPMAITGIIDMFVGADGMSRDWSVKLNGSPIADTGGIGEAGDTTAGNAKTVWTIGETAAAAAGNWTGNLRENGANGVPQVATGTFDSTYGTAGKMVGAFGANE